MAQKQPRLTSMLSQPIITDNFMPYQSALMTIGTGALSTSITFTIPPNTQRVTYKFANTGTKAAYVCVSSSTGPNGIVAAVASSSTPQPTSTLLSISTCDCIPGGAILTQDYLGGYDTVSGISASGNNTSLEITVGGGQ
jgi:hypothetical protein